MSGSKWIWVAGLVALCSLACGNRTVVMTKPEDKPVPGADEVRRPAEEGEGSVDGETGRVIGGAVKLDVPEVKAPEGIEVKLDGTLTALVRAFREGGEDAVTPMVGAGKVELAENRLRVGMTVRGVEQVEEVKRKIEGLGGEVTVEFGNRIFALLPVAALEPLAQEESVWSMEAPQQVVSPFKRK